MPAENTTIQMDTPEYSHKAKLPPLDQRRNRSDPNGEYFVPHGANYCTAFGYDCTEPHGSHDTHTRLMPHDRRNGILSGEGSIALLAGFIAVNALSTLTELTFKLPDFVGGDCPGLCTPEYDPSTWTAAQIDYNKLHFDVTKINCTTAPQKWADAYTVYVTSLAIVAICGLLCAIQNAFVIGSGTYLLFDAREAIMERDLVRRFDKWWGMTCCCRFIFNRCCFFLMGVFYFVAMFYHPNMLCGSFGDETHFLNYSSGKKVDGELKWGKDIATDQEVYSNMVYGVKVIGMLGIIATVINWVFLFGMEKLVSTWFMFERNGWVKEIPQGLDWMGCQCCGASRLRCITCNFCCEGCLNCCSEQQKGDLQHWEDELLQVNAGATINQTGSTNATANRPL